MNATGDYWICVSTLDQTKEYTYVADVVLNKQEVLSALTDEPEEVQEIINYSKGLKIRLTFLERLLLFIRKN